MSLKGILKIFMIIFNSAIFLAGAAAVVIGILAKKHAFGLLKTIKDNATDLTGLSNANYVLIAVGAVLALMGFLSSVSFLGVCKSDSQNKRKLLIFFIVMLIVLIMEVVAAVYILFHKSKVEKLLQDIRVNVGNLIKVNYGENNMFTSAWNQMMALIKCCGYNSYEDFTGSPYVNKNSLYPQFCCSPASVQCFEGTAASQSVHGCLDTVVNLVKDNIASVVGVAICVIVIEVAVMVVSMILYKR
ncbi:tetraspanin-1-like [Ictalurus furcatus]|uniref:tetraspanin-1-like n=1 Tax=Ictalurus furcatus TaxID=66913 RepID=UPI002350C127|nr:tetraspanin-1-like [Ictalurus furcatus]